MGDGASQASFPMQVTFTGPNVYEGFRDLVATGHAHEMLPVPLTDTTIASNQFVFTHQNGEFLSQPAERRSVGRDVPWVGDDQDDDVELSDHESDQEQND
eukprot:c16884_g1_i2.p4 GENE.c16884_g1_i2~~c16884_g1_i2.p4  ORF type:complete len:100 (-),score=21.61 c16884_g1_i2:17-316(-)